MRLSSEVQKYVCHSDRVSCICHVLVKVAFAGFSLRIYFHVSVPVIVNVRNEEP